MADRTALVRTDFPSPPAPLPLPEDVPSGLDLFLSRPAPHVLAALAPVLAGLALNNPALAIAGAMLVVVYSNFLMRRRLLDAYRQGAYRRFLAMANRIQDSFPVPFRPMSNLPELRAIAHVKVGEAERGKQIFRSVDPHRLSPAFQGISAYNMAIMFLEMQDPASALEILEGLDRERAGEMGDLLPLLKNAQLQAHFVRGEMEKASAILVSARGLTDVPAPVAVAFDGWAALLALEADRDAGRALALSTTALAKIDALESVQARDWLLINHALIELEAGGDPIAVLERLSALLAHEPTMSPYQRGLLHYVTAACQKASGQIAEARASLEAAGQACRGAWLEQRCAALAAQLPQE
jgi:hypothetical protein